MPRNITHLATLLVMVCFLGGAAGARAADGGESRESIQPARPLRSSAALLELGRATYEKQCAACHGLLGDGSGDAAYLLYPKPRDLTAGEYRLVSSWEGIPTEEDLFATISRGMPGSAMPSWAHLPERTRWGLVHYVRSLALRPLDLPKPAEPARAGDPGRGVIRVPEATPDSPLSRTRGRDLFVQGCAACHGDTGRGEGPQQQFDSRGQPTRPRDLTAGVFKGSPDPDEVYRRIVAGLPGSPMPSSPYLHGTDAWHLVRYVLSLSSPLQRALNEMKQLEIIARRVEQLPTHPDAWLWGSVEGVDIHLMPLWWRDDRPQAVTVRAVHDGSQLALLVVWPDATYDHQVVRPQDFRDAAAVQFALEADPPFFAMGEAQARVNLWMWKSERQADLEPAFQDIDRVYPNIGIDSYPNFERSPLEQPARHALTLESDPTFVTGWGAGNVVSDPLRQSAVEDLTARGFGTLRARPVIDWTVEATGVHAIGSYRVLFHRPLQGRGEGAASLAVGDRIPVAFAVWNGSAGDRDGKKSVTIWQQLVIAP